MKEPRGCSIGDSGTGVSLPVCLFPWGNVDCLSSIGDPALCASAAPALASPSVRGTGSENCPLLAERCSGTSSAGGPASDGAETWRATFVYPSTSAGGRASAGAFFAKRSTPSALLGATFARGCCRGDSIMSSTNTSDGLMISDVQRLAGIATRASPEATPLP